MWLVERGIGEDRAILTDGSDVLAARSFWSGELQAGDVVEATLTSRTAGRTRGTAALASGRDVLVDKLPRDLSEGASTRLEIRRASIGEHGRLKLPQGRVTNAPLKKQDLFASLSDSDNTAEEVRSFPNGLWGELIGDALARTVDFDGGSLLFAPTPAMLVVDVDGPGDPRELALAAITPLARALRQFDIGGMVGIDFPTLPTKADRHAIDEALEEALADWPHERTAMNGFGFVQIISRLERPSLIHRASHSRTGLLARQLLRKAEQIDDAGAIQLNCHPALKAKLKQEWLDELARRTGRQVRIEIDPGLALEGGFAQAVPI